MIQRQRGSPWRLSPIALIAAVVSAPILAQHASTPLPRSVEVEDIIRMTHIGGPRQEFDPSAPPVQFSPDGQQFAVITRRGDVEHNTNDYSLLLYRSSEAFDSPRPRVLLALTSSNNNPAISDAKWIDNTKLIYLGQAPGASLQLYSIDVRSGKIEQLTRHRGDVISFASTIDTVAYLALDPTLYREESGRELVVTNQPLSGLLTGHGAATINLYIQHRHRVKRVDIPDAHRLLNLKISRDGRYVIVQAESEESGQWKHYKIDVGSNVAREEALRDSDAAEDHRHVERRGLPLEITLEQDMNTPPRLFVFDTSSRKKALLLDTNPQLRTLRIGEVREISFRGTDGQEWRGGLYLPIDFEAGRRYPLVIQTHGWNPHRFALDGESSAGYAAQVLAGRGVVVAQLPLGTELTNAREGPQNMAMYEGLIGELDRESIIDHERVGIQAWSRTGYSVRYTLAFSKAHFAAAAFVDSLDGGYGQYLSWLNVGHAAVDTYEALNGGAPFGDGLESWFKRAPSFNTDHLTTPVHISVFSANTLLDNWEWFARSRYQHRPIEMTWLADSYHWPVRPSDRLAIQGGAVDWFRFWLQSYEDPDSKKLEQYRRWENMCDLQRAGNPDRSAFCVGAKR
jgi:dipeptidyl aminopeptidase/acylaminoacyl peptidase